MTLSNAHKARASGRAMNLQDPLISAHTLTKTSTHTHTHTQKHAHKHRDSCYPKGQAIVAKRADSVRVKLGQMFFSHFLQYFFPKFFFFCRQQKLAAICHGLSWESSLGRRSRDPASKAVTITEVDN